MKLVTHRAFFSLLFGMALLAPCLAAAQSLVPLGSSRSVTAEPPVARPASRPLTVSLFRDFMFTDYAARPFLFAPPANPKQRWAKIVLVCDFSVSAGRQFDRSAEISVGHTNIYFGTTAEPSDRVSPAWHVERDLTDYAALFRTAQPGEVTVGNTVDSKYTGIIHGTASLLFYPAAKPAALPPVPDVVLPLPAGKNGIGSADTPADIVSATYTLPTNTIRAYLDLITESQGNDEFWYLNAPDKLKDKLKAGGGTAFREAEVTVDGKPAGVAPVFPWIYTGGIDPSLWRPIPGIQTLNFAPYRVNLTPFVGLLNDGHPHTIGVRIVNNQNHFQIAGVLLLFRDPKLPVVHGALTTNTLTAPVLIVASRITDTNGTVSGPVSVTSHRQFTIAGYVETSAGKISTKIMQTVGFSSVQQFTPNALQTARQLSTLSSETQTQTLKTLLVQQDTFKYGLALGDRRLARSGGGTDRITSVDQSRVAYRQTSRNGRIVAFSRTFESADPSDTQRFDAAGKLLKRGQHSVQLYSYGGEHGYYTRTITADNGIVSGITEKGLPPGK